MNSISTENRKDLKLIDFSNLQHDDALFYHKYFKDNQIDYIEAPLLIYKNNVLKVYVSSSNDQFYKSSKYLFQLFTNKIVYKGKWEIAQSSHYLHLKLFGYNLRKSFWLSECIVNFSTTIN